MNLAVFFDRSPGTIGEYFEAALRSLGHTVEHFSTSQADACRGRYDVYLRIDHGDYSCEFPSRLRPSAFYVVDAHLAKSWKSIRRQAPHYDVIFCAQRLAAGALPRAHWVPMACDLTVHSRRPGPLHYDVAFVGNDGGVPRKFYLQELRERYPNSFIGKAPHIQMAEIYSQAKIGFHYIECTSPLKDMVSMRVYEILASGTLLCANALEAQAFEQVGFTDRRELVIYHQPEELFALIDYYLRHEEERQRIAEAGFRCVRQHHTYQHRAAQIVKKLQEQRGA